jgi:nucleoside phosphorylase
VLTIIDEEFDAVSSELKLTVHIPGSAYYCAEGGEADVVLRQAHDRSQVPAMGVAREVLEDYRPEVLIVVGIAGGIAGRDGVALGDVVAPKYVHYGEVRKLTSEGDDPRPIAFDQPSRSVHDCCVHPARRGNWHGRIPKSPPESCDLPKVISGSLVSAEKIFGDPTHHEQRELVRRYTDAAAVDMESYGVGRAVFDARDAVDYNPRLLVIRGISDLVTVADATAPDGVPDLQAEVENNDQRAKWKFYAAATAASFTAEVIEQFLASPDPRALRDHLMTPVASPPTEASLQ